MNIEQLVHILTAAIAPVIVISGVGLLLLSMTNRHSRVIDRARELMREAEDERRRESAERQLEVTLRRANILRAAIIAGSVSILFVVFTVIAIFVGGVLGLKKDVIAGPSFTVSLIALVFSLGFFLGDVALSLEALGIATRRGGRPQK